jgi:hypothetical protein
MSDDEEDSNVKEMMRSVNVKTRRLLILTRQKTNFKVLFWQTNGGTEASDLVIHEGFAVMYIIFFFKKIILFNDLFSVMDAVLSLLLVFFTSVQYVM